jgi:hypothetical protein
MAQRKHHFVYYCVIAGAGFDVTVLVWRKYATVLRNADQVYACISDVAGYVADYWLAYALVSVL